MCMGGAQERREGRWAGRGRGYGHVPVGDGCGSGRVGLGGRMSDRVVLCMWVSLAAQLSMTMSLCDEACCAVPYGGGLVVCTQGAGISHVGRPASGRQWRGHSGARRPLDPCCAGRCNGSPGQVLLLKFDGFNVLCIHTTDTALTGDRWRGCHQRAQGHQTYLPRRAHHLHCIHHRCHTESQNPSAFVAAGGTIRTLTP